MLSLVARFILYFAVSAFGVLAAITSLEYQKFDLEKSQSQLQESVRLLLTARALQSDLREPIRDISTIAALQVLSDYLRDETPANRVRVETVFQNFAQNAGVYDKIRYIDVAGMERVRVNYSGHVATAIPLAELEDKSGRYYFRETLHLTPNTIYISSLDLNVEDGQIEHPYKPMIRFAKAVSDSAGRLKGNVVLNYLGVILLDDFREFMADSWGEPMMVNREGYWLSSPDKVDEWGFLLGSNASFAKRYSEAWDYVTRHESGAVETKEGLFIFNTVHPYAVRTIRGATPAEESVAEQYWKIITRIPLQFLIYSPASVFEKRTNEITWLLLLVGILSAALAWLRTNYLSKVSALRESEKRLAEAEAIAHVGNWVWDIPMNKLSWSDTVYSIFGRHPRSFETSYGAFIAAIHPEDRDIVSDTVDAAMYKNKPYIIDHRIVLPDHTVRYVHERGAVQFDHTGQPVRMLGTIQDITESTQAAQALQASEARYHNLFENMVDGYALHEVVFDVKGKPYDYRYLQVNPAFERILGLSRQQVIGKTMMEVLAGSEPYWLEIFGMVALTGQAARVVEYGQSLGRYFEITVSCPERGLVAALFADVTERQQNEKQLQKYREQLEEMVVQRTAALEASYKELEAFSYSIAHDLRTPLRSITSFSQILKEEAGPKLTEQERQDLQRIVNAGRHMAQLIDDILELARISRSKFTIETIDLSAMVRSIVETLARVNSQRSVKVDIAPGLQCNGDARLLRIALENLLGNAWKYTSKRTDAHIEFGVTAKGYEKVYYVRDNGVGFDMQFIQKLFTPFGRLHRSDEFEGTGVGLVSAQSAIHRHNGKIWAESKEGEGSVFYFTLHVFHGGG